MFISVPVNQSLGLQVPAVLVTLRNYLYDHSGLRHEGVFRVQGDEKELQRIKNQLNKGTFTDCVDVNCIASLIKVCDFVFAICVLISL